MRLLATAIDWASAGRPFALFVRDGPARVTSCRLRRRLRAWRSIRLSLKRASICSGRLQWRDLHGLVRVIVRPRKFCALPKTNHLHNAK